MQSDDFELADFPSSLADEVSKYDVALLRSTRERRVIEVNSRTVEDDTTYISATVSSSGESRTIVSRSADALARELASIDLTPSQLARDRSLPIVFTNGSASLLFHEAVGHPSELTAQTPWPTWLTVTDDPRGPLVDMQHDDAGAATSTSVLTSGELPSARRRATFRDVPLRRMTNIIVTTTKQIKLPQARISVTAVAEGSFVRHSGEIHLRVLQAVQIRDGKSTPLAPFDLRSTLTQLAKSLAGGGGAVQTYPGVLCSEEGQRLPVGGAAVDIVFDADAFS